MQIRVYETVSQRPNGDRDTRVHSSSEFRVVLVNGDRRTTVFQNDQFDRHWTSINGTRDEYLRNAMAAASELAKTLGTCEIVGVEITNREKEIADLEVSIERDQARLKKLKARIE